MELVEFPDRDDRWILPLDPGDVVLIDGPDIREYGMVMGNDGSEVTIVTDSAIVDDEPAES